MTSNAPTDPATDARGLTSSWACRTGSAGVRAHSRGDGQGPRQVCSQERPGRPGQRASHLRLWLGGGRPFHWDCNMRKEPIVIYKRDGGSFGPNVFPAIPATLVPSGGSV